jgi:hypothetical protein
MDVLELVDLLRKEKRERELQVEPPMIVAKPNLTLAAYEADELFCKALRAHRLDRWSDSTNWPADVRKAFEAKKAADRAAFGA